MTKLCPRGKAAAKRKFKVYPSAYANMYASAVCSGKVTPGGKKKNKKADRGNLSQQSFVSEQYLLELEREAFLSLCGERKTLERIQYMLKNGKPLRN